MDPIVTTESEDRTVAMLSYVTVIGFIVALIMHGNAKTRLGAFHLRQALGLIASGFVVGLSSMVLFHIWFIGALSVFVAYGVLLVLWFIGFMAAVNGEFKTVPLLGQQFQTWFAGNFE